MRIMGLDYGDKTIGVAISDELGFTAQGIEIISRTSKVNDLARIGHLMQQYEVATIVVGLPKNMNGSIGPRGEKCTVFAHELGKKLNVPVQLWDERLTTVAAERTLLEGDVSRKKRKKVIDMLAAQLILQGFLDHNQMKG